MVDVPSILKIGLSAATVYPTDSDKAIIKKLENNHYIISLLRGSKSLQEVYLEAKRKQAEEQLAKQIMEQPKEEEKKKHKIF